MRQLLLKIILLTGMLSPIAFAAEPAELLVRQTVEAYCRNEFSGNDPETRERHVKFSPKLEAQFQKNGHSWTAKYVDIPQEVVVGAYEVKDVRIQGKRATAIVAYQRLARTDNHFNNPYIPDKKANDLVTLTLVYDKKQWWVLDPPPPRVSKEKLIEYYEYQVKEDSSMWEQKLNDPSYDEEQKANVRANRDRITGNLRILRELP